MKRILIFTYILFTALVYRGQMKCDGTRAETRVRLSAKRTTPFKSAGTSVQSTTGSRGVRISGINAWYTMFRGSVEGTGYPLHSPVSPSVPHPCVTVCHHILTGLYHYYLVVTIAVHVPPAAETSTVWRAVLTICTACLSMNNYNMLHTFFLGGWGGGRWFVCVLELPEIILLNSKMWVDIAA